MAKTSTGLEENISSLLCYVLGWVTGLIFILIEQDNKMVRFHAVQSIIVFGVLTIAIAIFRWIPVVGGFIAGLIGLIGFVLWVVLMIKAYQGAKYKLPGSGDLAEKWTTKSV